VRSVNFIHSSFFYYSWLVAVGKTMVIDITTMRIWFIATGLNE